MFKNLCINLTLLVYISLLCCCCNDKYIITKVEVFPANCNITDNEKKFIKYEENDYIKDLLQLLNASIKRNLFENDTLFCYSDDPSDADHLWDVLIKRGKRYYEYFIEYDSLIQKDSTGGGPLYWGINPNYLNDIFKNKFNIIQLSVNKHTDVWPVDLAIKIVKKQETMEITLYFISWCEYQSQISYYKKGSDQ